MKKWIIMGLSGLGAVLAVVWYTQPSGSIVVDAVSLSPRRVEQTVSCTGVVEAAGGTPVMLPISCVISSVEVKVGQRVEQGDVLATVDKAATRATLHTGSELMALAAMDERLTAPKTGVITAINGGTSTDPSLPYMMIVGEEDLQITVSIPEKDLPKLKSGMKTRVSGDGFTGKSYTGVLEEISYAASMDGGGATIRGLVSLDTTDPSLRLGLSARVSVITSVAEEGIVIPYEAVVSDEDGSFVYVAEDGVARRVAISPDAYVTDGVLLSDSDWDNRVVICQPDLVTEDGMTVEVTLP